MSTETAAQARRDHDRPRFAAPRVECHCRSFGFGRVVTPVVRMSEREAAMHRDVARGVPAVIGSITA